MTAQPPSTPAAPPSADSRRARAPDSASAEVRQLGATLPAINDRHGRLIDGLLPARPERGVTERSYVDLADIVEHVAASDTVKVLTEPGEAACSATRCCWSGWRRTWWRADARDEGGRIVTVMLPCAPDPV